MPSGIGQIFPLLSAGELHSDPAAIPWIRRNIIATVVGAFADVQNANHTPPPHTSMTLCDMCLCTSMTTREWDSPVRNAGCASVLPESPVLHIPNTRPGCAFLGRHVSGSSYSANAWSSSALAHLELDPAQTRRARRTVGVDAEELVNEGVFSSRGPLDMSAVKTRSVEVMFSCSDLRPRGIVWKVRGRCRLSAWFRAQRGPSARGEHRTLYPALRIDFS